MLKTLLDFFARLFGLGTKIPHTDDRVIEGSGPQDGAEVPSDSVTVTLPPDLFDLEEEETGDAGDENGSGDESRGDENPGDEPPKAVREPRYLWCLDNGHGKATPGKRSPKFENGSQLFEYELVRDIVARIIKVLDEEGVKYYNVVPEVEGDIKLSTRCNRANDKSSSLDKIYLSVHSNANGKSGWNAAEGLETWYHRNSKKGVRLASAFQKHLMAHLDMKDRGIRCHTPVRKAFYVLRNTAMSAVLTENGFYTNKVEASKLMKDEVRQKIADAHVAAILEIEDKGIEQIELYPKNVTIDLS